MKVKFAASWRGCLTFHLFSKGWRAALFNDDGLNGTLGAALADLGFSLLDDLNLVHAENRAAPELARREVVARAVAPLVLAAGLPLRAAAGDRGWAARHLARVAAVKAAAAEALARLLRGHELRSARSFAVESGRHANARHASPLHGLAGETLAATLVLEAAAGGFPGASEWSVFSLAREA